MKTLISLFFLAFSLGAQNVFAADWTHIELKKDGHTVRISYTTMYLPATIGHHGGRASGELYVDVYSSNPSIVERVEVGYFKAEMKEDNSTHAWAKLCGNTYGHHLWIGKDYTMKIVINGQDVEFKFEAI